MAYAVAIQNVKGFYLSRHMRDNVWSLLRKMRNEEKIRHILSGVLLSAMY